jgi:hypothetical protein
VLARLVELEAKAALGPRKSRHLGRSAQARKALRDFLFAADTRVTLAPALGESLSVQLRRGQGYLGGFVLAAGAELEDYRRNNVGGAVPYPRARVAVNTAICQANPWLCVGPIIPVNEVLDATDGVDVSWVDNGPRAHGRNFSELSPLALVLADIIRGTADRHCGPAPECATVGFYSYEQEANR